VDDLRGAHMRLDNPTVTGTENILMAAVLADGVSVIENAAREPEIVDLVHFLRSMGARIKGEGTSVLEVDGVPALRPARRPHSILPDRIEAGTYLVAGAISGGDVTVTGVRPGDLSALIAALREAGCLVEVGESHVRVRKGDRLCAVDVRTEPHPGFPTDMQAQWMALMCTATGSSRICETIFENRFMHVSELTRLGATIDVDAKCAQVDGHQEMRGASVMATDLRASASLILAGLAAKGRTEVLRLYHLDRGYSHLERKFVALGARVARVPDNQPKDEVDLQPSQSGARGDGAAQGIG
jgi:UDP-N-acetylglucosamine 1-carboxyvinyltransferase